MLQLIIFGFLQALRKWWCYSPACFLRQTRAERTERWGFPVIFTADVPCFHCSAHLVLPSSPLTSVKSNWRKCHLHQFEGCQQLNQLQNRETRKSQPSLFSSWGRQPCRVWSLKSRFAGGIVQLPKVVQRDPRRLGRIRNHPKGSKSIKSNIQKTMDSIDLVV